MKCHLCKRAKCIWLDIKNVKKATNQQLEDLLIHNLSYIDMVFQGHQGSAHAEERMHNKLEPYQVELDKRKSLISAAPALFKALKELLSEIEANIIGTGANDENSSLEQSLICLSKQAHKALDKAKGN